jgi:hypothetical protein
MLKVEQAGSNVTHDVIPERLPAMDGDANNTVNGTDKTAVWTHNVSEKIYLNAD